MTNELRKNSHLKIGKQLEIFEIQNEFGYNETEDRSKIHAG
jgi:hypothetical protein